MFAFGFPYNPTNSTTVTSTEKRSEASSQEQVARQDSFDSVVPERDASKNNDSSQDDSSSFSLDSLFEKALLSQKESQPTGQQQQTTLFRARRLQLPSAALSPATTLSSSRSSETENKASDAGLPAIPLLNITQFTATDKAGQKTTTPENFEHATLTIANQVYYLQKIGKGDFRIVFGFSENQHNRNNGTISFGQTTEKIGNLVLKVPYDDHALSGGAKVNFTQAFNRIIDGYNHLRKLNKEWEAKRKESLMPELLAGPTKHGKKYEDILNISQGNCWLERRMNEKVILEWADSSKKVTSLSPKSQAVLRFVKEILDKTANAGKDYVGDFLPKNVMINSMNNRFDIRIVDPTLPESDSNLYQLLQVWSANNPNVEAYLKRDFGSKALSLLSGSFSPSIAVKSI